MTKKILVTGGTVMVGKYLNELIPNGTFVGSKDCDLINPIQVQINNLLETEKPDGQYRKTVCSNKMISTLGEFSFTPFRDGIRDTYEAEQKSY